MRPMMPFILGMLLFADMMKDITISKESCLSRRTPLDASAASLSSGNARSRANIPA